MIQTESIRGFLVVFCMLLDKIKMDYLRVSYWTPKQYESSLSSCKTISGQSLVSFLCNAVSFFSLLHPFGVFSISGSPGIFLENVFFPPFICLLHFLFMIYLFQIFPSHPSPCLSPQEIYHDDIECIFMHLGSRMIWDMGKKQGFPSLLLRRF